MGGWGKPPFFNVPCIAQKRVVRMNAVSNLPIWDVSGLNCIVKDIAPLHEFDCIYPMLGLLHFGMNGTKSFLINLNWNDFLKACVQCLGFITQTRLLIPCKED